MLLGSLPLPFNFIMHFIKDFFLMTLWKNLSEDKPYTLYLSIIEL